MLPTKWCGMWWIRRCRRRGDDVPTVPGGFAGLGRWWQNSSTLTVGPRNRFYEVIANFPAVKSRLPIVRLIVPLAVGAADDAGLLPLPTEIVVAPWGESRKAGGGVVRVGKKTLAALAANQAKAGYTEIALDFNHNTYEEKDGKPVRPAEPIKIAAYGTLSVREGVGIVFTPTRWTPEGREHYQGGHYRDLSPTVAQDVDGEVLFVHSVALCRQGVIENLHAYSATVEIEVESKTQSTMDPKALLLKLLNLPETATDEEIAAAAETLAGKLAAMGADKKEEKPAADMAAYSALAARVDAMEKESLVAKAVAAGKVIPLSAEAIKALPLSALAATLDALPPGKVATSAKTTEAAPSTEQKLAALSAGQKLVAEQLGIDPAKMLATA